MTTEQLLRIWQGSGFLAGGLLAVVSVWSPTVLGGIQTVALGLAAFALGFAGAASAAYIGGHQRRAGLSILAAGAFVVLIVAPSDLGVVGTVALFITGMVLWADSLTEGGLRELVPI